MSEVNRVYRFVAEKYGIESILGDNIGYYIIEEESSVFESGDRKQELENIINTQDVSNVYGFCFDSEHVEGIDEGFVALGLKKELALDSEYELTEMIALHELAHLIEKLNLWDDLELKFDECDEILANKIVNHLDKWGGDILGHNLEFIKILNSLIKKVNANNSQHFMRIAMSKTLLDIENAIISKEIDEQYYGCE